MYLLLNLQPHFYNMKNILTTGFLALISLVSFSQGKYTRYVDPFIGTGGHGHTYPGAVLPHGMVQLSPDTRLDGWDGCSGYHHSDNYIYGFTHTHLSGTGCSDYGDILLMPTMGAPTPDNKKYGSHFTHAKEKASPGYYSVELSDNNILAELTTTTRVGFHRYSALASDKTGKISVILDLKHRDDVLENSINVEDSFTVTGLRRSRAWAQNQYVYFAIKFSKPISNYGIYANDTLKTNLKSLRSSGEGRKLASRLIKAFFTFNSDKVMAKVALSLVSVDGAMKNLQAELPGWDFDKVKAQADAQWDKELGKIEITSDSTSKMRTFYTALYHTMVAPNVNSDVDGQYRGMDNKIHKAEGFTYYSVFSLWDTYRGAHPLYTIIDRARSLDYIKTFLAQYRDGGRLPVWELSSNETDCMIGYHSVPVIVDAFVKGINGFDKSFALEAMEKSATGNRYGLPALMDHGYLETLDEHENVSKTLEYAYDDWCIAKFAKMIGREDDYKAYIKRAQAYKNLLDIQSGFMRPKTNGDWLSPFDPREVNNNFTEANSWQYSFYVPQDVDGYINMLGGRKRLEMKLDSLFTESSKTTGREQEDISGLIGQYAHGNEPSHHIAYLYDFAGKPSKTQEKVHQIMTTMYRDTPDGLEGNEDCGQMSAWYVLSSLGFYPVTPGTEDLMLGTPLFRKTVIHLENGKTFTINAPQMSETNYYVSQTSMNSKPYYKSWITYSNIVNGGQFNFLLTNTPTTYGENYPASTSITDNLIVMNPIILGGDKSYAGDKRISIYSNQDNVTIYYTLDGTNPTTASLVYKNPFRPDTSPSLTINPALPYSNELWQYIKEQQTRDNAKNNRYELDQPYKIVIKGWTIVKAIAVNDKGEMSKVTTAVFHKRSHDWNIALNTPYEPEFTAGGNTAVIDELRGTTDWRKGNWQGYRQNDVDVVIDMKQVTPVSKVSAGFLQDTRAWIVMPKQLIVEVSEDGKSYKEVYKGENFLPIEDLKVQTKEVEAKFDKVNARYIRIRAIQYGKLPAWHESAGNDPHIFIDEISVD
jgi:predicted alpha-1,2-mannosidase